MGRDRSSRARRRRAHEVPAGRRGVRRASRPRPGAARHAAFWSGCAGAVLLVRGRAGRGTGAERGWGSGGAGLRAARPGSRLGRAGRGSGSSRPLCGPATPGGVGSAATRSLARPRLCSSRTAACRPSTPTSAAGAARSRLGAAQSRTARLSGAVSHSRPHSRFKRLGRLSSTNARLCSGHPDTKPAGRCGDLRWRQRRSGGRAGAQAWRAPWQQVLATLRTDPCRTLAGRRRQAPPDPCRSENGGRPTSGPGAWFLLVPASRPLPVGACRSWRTAGLAPAGQASVVRARRRGRSSQAAMSQPP